MSWEAAQWAEQCKTGKPSRKAVLLVLANAAINKPIIDRAGSAYQCHLSHDTLARRSDCSIDTAQRACVWLESQGLVLRELRYFRGRRTSNNYYLNVRREAPKTFANRLGIDWESGGAKPQSAAYSKDEPGDLNQEREAGLSEKKRAALPDTWSLPDDWRRQTLAEYIATSDAINRSSQRFHELKGRTPRTAAQWRNEWESWCRAERNFQHKPPAGGPSLEVWRAAVRLWVGGGRWDPQLGPDPSQSGCIAPPAIRDEFAAAINRKMNRRAA
jgi:hypothetical protein